MKGQFVTGVIGQQLKEKGFNEPCMANVYTGDTGNNIDRYCYGAITPEGNVAYKDCNSYDMCYSLPLWQQVIDWFREKHFIDIMIRQTKKDGTAYYKITKIETEDKIKGYSNFCKTVNIARQVAIEHALTLI
jgi:hypothetical protein